MTNTAGEPPVSRLYAVLEPYRPFRDSCPVLVIARTDDDITTIGHAAEITDGIPGARLTVIPDCGHLSTLEQPAAVTEALAGWFGQ